MKILASIGAATAALALSTAAAEPAFPPLTTGDLQDCVGAGPPPPLGCRIRRDLTPEEAQRRLAGRPVAVWVDGDAFSVVARSTEEAPVVNGALNGAPLARLPGTDLWTISVRMGGLDAALLDAYVRPGPGQPARAATWRGARAEPPPQRAAVPLVGRLLDVDFDSPNLGGVRRVSVYLPPGFDAARRHPVIYMADGEGMLSYATLLEPLIVARKLPPTVIVGLHSGDDLRRGQEYILGFRGSAAEFEAHERFFLQEVLPRAEREWGASSARVDRLLMGHSNGAAWAVDTALRHPDLFGAVYAVSVAGGGARTVASSEPIRFFLAAGDLEPPFRRTTAQRAEEAARAGHMVTLKTVTAGHSPMVVQAFFDDAVTAAFPLQDPT